MSETTQKSGGRQAEPEVQPVDPVALGHALSDIAERSQKLVADFLQKQQDQSTGQKVPDFDPLNLGQAFFEMTQKMMADPTKLMQAQIDLWSDYMTLWQRTTQRMLGQDYDPVIAPERGDRRFKDSAWEENAVFDYIKQSYLLTARWMQSTAAVEGMEPHDAQKIDFYTRQFVDAMAPSNFVLTNPEVLRTTVETGGENLLKGLDNLLGDLERGKGELMISMTDTSAFTVGDNIAVTEGKVVYENDLMQLIQYSPTTETVMQRPLLIVPPWINKYYILDLRAKNSFVKWCVDQGITVFMISWVNPDESLADKGFEDYMREGPLAAMDAIEKVTGEHDLNMIGYCLGGTLTASTLAVMEANGTADRVKSVTFFTTMLDFDEPGELGVFIDEAQLDHLEDMMSEKGYLDGTKMATTFNMLRANDLIWSFVVNNYLLGKDPFPFDLLYWNSDSTRMPAKMHSYYLRNMYQRNLLAQPGGIELEGVSIDLSTVKTPTFFLSTREDHIAPWKSTYRGVHLLKGPVKFCLSASGHIAGVVNPPAAEKYCYWMNTAPRPAKDPDQWLEKAKQTDGSWWPEWRKWLDKYSGKSVPARDPAAGGLPVIEDAPGRYVAVRIVGD